MACPKFANILICLSLWILLDLSDAQFSNLEVHEYSDCKGNYQRPVGVASGAISDKQMTASTYQKKRVPEYGRLHSPRGAWSPSIQNAFQWLQIDLPEMYVVTTVQFQGRQGSDEFVREFFLEYSDDGETWRRYTNQLGIPEIFDGNDDDHTLKQKVLQYPIVAKHIRFNPQRWNMVIAMRVEILGCPFSASTASFDGESYIQYDLSPSAITTENDLLELRFRTGRPDGVLFYVSGKQGDIMMLEMRRGYLYFKLDLGSTTTEPGMNEVKAGSLLDDNQWHDVIITRSKKKLKVVVDRLINEVKETNGLFFRLDIDKNLYIGGVPFFNMDGIKVKYNFFGCVQNVNLNGAKLIADAIEHQKAIVQNVGNVNPYCSVETKVPITFPTIESHISVKGVSAQMMHVSFEFRTHDTDGLLVYHPADNGFVLVRVDASGHISYTVKQNNGQEITDVVRNTDMVSATDQFTDGLWHMFEMYVDRKKINCTVDRNVKVSERKVDISPQDIYYIGGFNLSPYGGFRGCIRNLFVAQRSVDVSDKTQLKEEDIVSAEVGTCAIRDRCTPNPCEHGGICEQSWNTFTCDCMNTGYKGELCHTPSHYISCDLYKQYSNQEGKEQTIIDIDGSGPFKPFDAFCERDEDTGEIITYLSHDATSPTRVNGYAAPGSYVKKLKYAADDVRVLEEIVDRAVRCRQNIKYRCMNAKLLADPGDNDPAIKAWGWWVGRTYQPMYYWGGAAPGSGKCQCGLEEDGCGSQSSTCFCDKNIQDTSERKPEIDQGLLEHKEYLPVLEVHLGDTGSSTTDNKWSEFEVGELECFGDNLLDSTVTFTQTDGALEFGTFLAESAGDIWFQFKTTQSDGVMIHCTGSKISSDFVEIRLFQSDTMQFRYDKGSGVAVLPFKAPSPLDDDRWHTIHVEINRKQAWIKVDDYPDKSLSEDADLVRRLDLSGPLVVGSLVDYQDGFVGCMRGLRVNGVLQDMRQKLAEKDFYGVRPGCVGKCASNPCFHGGTCREGYNRYTCDCSYTPWRGWNCGREVGVNLKNNYMIKYQFDELQGLSASDFQFAQIGFSTKIKQGILLQMRSKDGKEYISVEMNNNGGVKVVMDVGFEGRVEVNTEAKTFVDVANSQVHVVTIERSNYGKTLKVQVDDYPAGYGYFSTDKSADTILDDPLYLFIGNNDTSKTQSGFEGCIYRMQVDNIFPLKRAFQDPKPSYLTLIPADKIQEDMCGFEEVTVSPEPVRRRPYSGVLLNVTYEVEDKPLLTTEEKVLVGVGTAILCLLLICLILFCCRHRFEGADYETEEATGAEYADNPDSAVVFNQTGLPNMAKSYEYFM